MPKVITIKAWRRPSYYLEVLNALQRCDGIGDYLIISCLDRTDHEALTQHETINRIHPLSDQIETLIPMHKYGCAGNTRRSFEEGFNRGAEFVIHLEDDTVPSKDYLRYMEWTAQEFKNNPDIFVVVGYNRRLEADIDKEINWVGVRRSPVTYQAWGMWDYTWDELKDEWYGIHWKGKEPTKVLLGNDFLGQITKTDDGSWGWPMLMYWPVKDKSLSTQEIINDLNNQIKKEVFPYISRCQNIGATFGKFNQNPTWHLDNIHTPIWAEDRMGNTYDKK